MSGALSGEIGGSFVCAVIADGDQCVLTLIERNENDPATVFLISRDELISMRDAITRALDADGAR